MWLLQIFLQNNKFYSLQSKPLYLQNQRYGGFTTFIMSITIEFLTWICRLVPHTSLALLNIPSYPQTPHTSYQSLAPQFPSVHLAVLGKEIAAIEELK